MYNKINMADNEPFDEPQDVNGYLGSTKFYRKSVMITPITAKEFI